MAIIEGLDFVAIDFETASNSPDSICEAGICVVRDGKIVETQSWLVRPPGNQYNYWNTRIHGIRPKDTANAPDFPEVWREIEPYLEESPVLVAHNAAFDMGCLRHAIELHGMVQPSLDYYCSLRAARHIYDFYSNTLTALCDVFELPQGTHHRAGDDAEMCARLFLREIKDAGWVELSEMTYCHGKL